MEKSITNVGHFALFMLLLSVSTSSKNVPSDFTEKNILMRDAKPLKPDSYLCSAYPVEEDEAYIYKFEAMAEASTAHHMLLYGCDGPEYPHTGDIWFCPSMCKGRSQTIMFAWAKNAPPTVFPKDVGLKIGQKSRIKTIVLQIHYAKSFSEDSEPDKSGLKLYITKQKTKYSAGILLMMSTFFQIPPRTSFYPVDISCKYNKLNSIYPFAYRTHSHGLGQVITGYQYNNSYHMIGKGNPQWPQAFYPVKNIVEVKHNDYLAARCTFNSTGSNTITSIGATADDEMCNFYIMYYTDGSVQDETYECYSNEYPKLTGNHFPADVSVPLPHNALLEEEASGHHHHSGHPTQQQQNELIPVDIPTTQTPTEPSHKGKAGDTYSASSEHQTNSGVRSQTDIKLMASNNNENKKTESQNGNDKRVQKITNEKADSTNHRSKLQGYETLQSDGKYQQSDNQMNVRYPNYDYDNINPRDLSSHKQHRMNQEYYDDYAANDWREQNRYQGDSDSNSNSNSDVELSRNRNKEFDAMNKQLLQQQYSNSGGKTLSKSRSRLLPGHQQHQMQTQRGRGRAGVQNQGRQSSMMETNNGGGGRDGSHTSGKMSSSSSATRLSGQSSGGDGNGGDLVKMPHSNIHIEKKLVYVPSWPEEMLNIGQVGGVSADKDGNVYIFHRASRIWDYSSFDYNDDFRYPDAPIDSDVVTVLDKNGKFIRKFGKGKYFMPHGITVDLEGNIWLTDVAMHQVFKIPKDGEDPVQTWGHRFKHSEDLSYFCKPSDVAILSTGEFFVADGYCNSRIVKFSKDGKVIKAWGKKNLRLSSNPEPTVFEVVHNLAVSEKDNLICAADRENGRIQCFDLDGNYKHIIKHKEFGNKLFALDFSPLHGGVLYAVNGPSNDGHSNPAVQGFTMDMKNGALIDQWNLPQGLKEPHDLCVDPISDSVYVGELDPRMVWKLTRMSDEEAKEVFVNLNHNDDDDDDHDDDNHVDGNDNTELHKKEHKVLTAAPPTVSEKMSNSGNQSNSSAAEIKKMNAIEDSGLSASMVMGLILIVPVVLLLIVVLVVRSYRSGNLKFLSNGGKGNKRIFNMQNILGNSHKGFDPLSTEESDHDLDPDDSDQEEYAAPRKAKT